MPDGFDVAFARAQFPALNDPGTRLWTYLDNAGGTFVCQAAVQHMSRFLETGKVQPYGAHPLSVRAGQSLDHAYRVLASLLNAGEDEVVLGPNTTVNLNTLAAAMRPLFRAGDAIVTTDQDHEANIGAWRRLAEALDLTVRVWHVDPETGALPPGGLDAVLDEAVRLVAVPHTSNVTGAVNDVAAIAAKARRAGAWVVVDGVAHAPHAAVDVKGLDVDAYAFSPYKTCGPHAGVLYVRDALMERLAGQNHAFLPDTARLQLAPGGPAPEAAAGLLGVADYLNALYARHFPEAVGPLHERAAAVFGLTAAHEAAVIRPLLDALADHPRVRLLGPGPEAAAERAPTVAFTVDGMASADVVEALLPHRIALRSGHFYAWRLMQALGLDPADGVVRASAVHYTSEAEVRGLVEALETVLPR